jgi:hypothetical protein
MKNTIIAVIVIVVVVGAGIFIWSWSNRADVGMELNGTPGQNGMTDTPDPADTGAPAEDEDGEDEDANRPETVIGRSADGHDIVAYHFGQGETELLFVGGIHGGYSWNTALLAQALVNHLRQNPNAVPDGVKVTVIPVLNPDGLDRVTGTVSADFSAGDVSTSQTVLVSGRFNGNNVDLNRNFDCEWQASGTWQNRTVSGGSAPFSEPEAAAIRDYVAAKPVVAALVWYSAAGGVYASNCGRGVLPQTRTILNAYANASGYPAYESFDFYAITGDMTNWLARSDIPAVSVLLTNHTDVEWTKNRAGIEALLQLYAE